MTKIARINDKNSLIFYDNHRNKRAPLNFIGNVQRALFGVLDDKFEEMYANDMRVLVENQEHLDILLKNHTSVIDASINIAMKHDSELKSLNSRINNITTFIKSYNLNSIGVSQHFNMASLQLSQLAFEYEFQQDSILEILTDSHKNHVNHYLFPPSQIRKEVELISGRVRNHFLVPEGHDLYKIIEIYPFISKNQFVFKISIPLFRLEYFNIHKIIRVPSIHKDVLWKIESSYDYLITATNHRIFQLMSELDYTKCMNYKKNVVVCKRPQQWFTSQISEFCEWNLFNHNSDNGCKMNHGKPENVFLEMNQNKWIFVIPNSTKMTAFCNNKAIYDDLQGEGISELSQNCVLSIKNIQLDANRIIEDAENEVIVPRIDHSVLMDIHSNKLELSKQNFIESNFTQLREMLINVRENSIHKLNHHDIHHYSIVYFIIVVGFVYIGIRFMVQ